MLLSSNELIGYKLGATDGNIGKTKDFYFNDENWVIRYLVADTATWLIGRKVLISPISLGTVDHKLKTVEVKLSKQKIKDSPSLEDDKPVSRQFEIDYYRFFGWPVYWNGDMLWGVHPYPIDLLHSQKNDEAESLIEKEDGDPHLRSIVEVRNYHIEASDGQVGHVEDFIIDEETWRIRYLVVDTRDWLPGRKVIINPDWATKVDYSNSLVHIDLNSEEIKNSPEYDPRTPINREYELKLFDFYGRPYYW